MFGLVSCRRPLRKVTPGVVARHPSPLTKEVTKKADKKDEGGGIQTERETKRAEGSFPQFVALDEFRRKIVETTISSFPSGRYLIIFFSARKKNRGELNYPILSL